MLLSQTSNPLFFSRTRTLIFSVFFLKNVRHTSGAWMMRHPVYIHGMLGSLRSRAPQPFVTELLARTLVYLAGLSSARIPALMHLQRVAFSIRKPGMRLQICGSSPHSTSVACLAAAPCNNSYKTGGSMRSNRSRRASFLMRRFFNALLSTQTWQSFTYFISVRFLFRRVLFLRK